MLRTSLGVLAIPCLLALGLSKPVCAQQVFGNIYGTVTDASGAGVPNAKVTITDQDKGTKFESATNSDGNYSKDRLIPGRLYGRSGGTGFPQSRQQRCPRERGPRLAPGREAGGRRCDPAGGGHRGRAPAAIGPGGRRHHFHVGAMEQLPSFDRNAQSYLLLTPGRRQAEWLGPRRQREPAGQQADSGERPALQRHRLPVGRHREPEPDSRHHRDQSEPRFAGREQDLEPELRCRVRLCRGGHHEPVHQVAAPTSSTARRSNICGPTPAGSPISGAIRSPSRMALPPCTGISSAGRSAGPLVKNKIFWFGDAQLTRQRTGSTVLTNVPTLLARTGDLSQYVDGTRNIVYDPLTGNPATGQGRTPFAGNRIPQNRLSPQALKILALVPQPNAVDPGGSPFRNNFVGGGSNTFNANNWDTRWDWFVNDRSSRCSDATATSNSTSLRRLLSGFRRAVRRLQGNRFSGTSEARNQSLAIGYTRTISPTMVNDFRFGYMRYRVNVLPGDIGTSPAKDAGIPGLEPGPLLHVRNPVLPHSGRRRDQDRIFARCQRLQLSAGRAGAAVPVHRQPLQDHRQPCRQVRRRSAVCAEPARAERCPPVGRIAVRKRLHRAGRPQRRRSAVGARDGQLPAWARSPISRGT